MDTIKIICGSENGIGLSEVSNHHLKKKNIHLCMEGLNTIDGLYESIKDLTPGEAKMRIFDFICPYDSSLP
jgi:hypothetical protein